MAISLNRSLHLPLLLLINFESNSKVIFWNGNIFTKGSARGRLGLYFSLHNCERKDQWSQTPQTAAFELHGWQCKLCRATTTLNVHEFLKIAKESSREGKVRVLRWGRKDSPAWRPKLPEQTRWAAGSKHSSGLLDSQFLVAVRIPWAFSNSFEVVK